MSDLMVDARGIGKRFRRGSRIRGISLPTLSGLLGRNRSEEFWALKDIDLQLRRGESLGIIGPNGAGKSTLLKILSRVTAPTAGTLKVWGRVGALIEVGAGFHPELSGRDNVYINGAILGMSRREITRRFDEIVSFAELEDFIDTPVKKYSSGMYVRLGFAVAAHMDPDILLVDEVLAVGDAAFHRKCFNCMVKLKQQGVPVILVSHNLAQVQQFCEHGVLINHGSICARGNVNDIVQVYYSELLQRTKGESSEETASGPFQITRVEALDPRTLQPLEAIPLGGDLTLRIHWRTRDPLTDVHFQVLLMRFDGQISGSTHSRLAMTGTVTRQFVGTGSVTATLHNLNLVPGGYAVEVWATDSRHATDYDVHRGLDIRVDGPTDIDGKRYGSYVFDADWDFGVAETMVSQRS